MNNKNISMKAATQLIKSGQMLALGGMTLYRRPMAFVLALIENAKTTGSPNNLTLLNFTSGLESDLLVGAGLVCRLRTCYFGLEIFGLAPMFTYYANRGEIEIIEETEASIALGLRAQMSGIGFMPGNAWVGTDLPRLRPDVKTIDDPYTGETLTAFPAIKPDLAVVHALVADEEGNAVIGDNKAIDNELVLVADTVIVTTEKIVPKLAKVDLISPLVDAIVLAPGGARPTSCHPEYALDGKSVLNYVEQVSDPESFERFLDAWLKSGEPIPSGQNRSSA
jgi:glutaconate CoA-transferase subunit A